MRRLVFVTLILSAYVSMSQIRLKIRQDMISDEKAYPNASPYLMFDEQASLKAEPPAGKPVTKWSSYIDKDLFYPLSAIIDLGKDITVSNIYIYDGGGQSNVTFYSRLDAGWELLFKDPLTNYETWTKHQVNKKCRYIRIVSDGPDGDFPEVVLYGDMETLPPVYPSVPEPSYPVFEDFAGVNILHVHDINQASVFKNIRQFHMWAWNEANTDIVGYPGFPNNKYGFNPAPVSNWNFDKVYSDYQAKGLRILPVLQGSPFWMFNSTSESVLQGKPVTGTEDPAKPSSYAEHADYMFQFAARYGKVAVPLNKLKIKSDNTPKSGLGTIEGVENWNEPNKTWEGRKGLFLPFEFAAMTSADYDGHQGALGPNAGVKNADPDLPFIMGGLSELDSVYLKSMLLWFRLNRTDFKNPFNIVNFHHYSNDAGGQGGNATTAISPEADGLEKKVRDVVGFCHRNLVNKPIWITEFGYDVHQESPQRAKVYGTLSGEDVQAMWLVRSFLAIYAGGADRAYTFWLQDGDSRQSKRFESSGLVQQIPPAKPTPKKSYYWLATMVKVLGKYKLSTRNKDGETYIYKFKHGGSADTSIYCVWNGTANGSKRTFSLPVDGGQAFLITPATGTFNGNISLLPVQNNRVSLNVGEDPVYIKVFGKPDLLGIEQPANISDNVILFPNPASELTYVSVPGSYAIREVTISDAEGKIINEVKTSVGTSSAEIHTAALKNGIYTVKITGDRFIPVFRKLIITK